MNGKVSKILRKVAKKADAPLKTVKRKYNEIPRPGRGKLLKELKRKYAI